MTYNQINRTLRKALANLGVRISAKNSTRPTLRLWWLATDGAKGCNSCLNIEVEPSSVLDRERYVSACQERQEQVARTLYEAGLTVFSYVDPFRRIDGTITLGGKSVNCIGILHADMDYNKHARSHLFATKHELHPALGRFA